MSVDQFTMKLKDVINKVCGKANAGIMSFLFCKRLWRVDSLEFHYQFYQRNKLLEIKMFCSCKTVPFTCSDTYVRWLDLNLCLSLKNFSFSPALKDLMYKRDLRS